jgi:hypothetical protein
MTALLLVALVPGAFAATREDIDQPQVFVKQEGSGTCTLASVTMMLRRTAMLRGDQDWDTITFASCRAAFWISGCGLPYNFEYDGMQVSKANLPGGEANRQILIDLLAEHPEGIVLHAAGVPHAVLLTDYTDGVFYCSDPAENKPQDRIPITEAYGTRIENSYAYWYVTSPCDALEPSESVSAVADVPDVQETEPVIQEAQEAQETQEEAVTRKVTSASPLSHLSALVESATAALPFFSAQTGLETVL